MKINYQTSLDDKFSQNLRMPIQKDWQSLTNAKWKALNFNMVYYKKYSLFLSQTISRSRAILLLNTKFYNKISKWTCLLDESPFQVWLWNS